MSKACRRLSILMPTCNGAPYLATALESIAAQGDDDVEVIAVDDGSDDQTVAILEQHAQTLPLRIVSREHRGNWVTGTNEALSLARENRDRHGLENRVELLRSDLLGSLRPEPLLDAVVSNPPYVADGEHEGLPPEVRDHEPRLALTSGAEGLDATLRLIEQAPSRLRPGGLIALECAFTRAEPVRRQLEEGGFEQVELLDDLAGVPRLALARRIGRQGAPQEAR